MPQELNAQGLFEIQLDPASTWGEGALQRRGFRKQYRGALEGEAVGEMLSAGHPRQGEAGYVALEVFRGRLHGRSGAFAVAQLGLLSQGLPELRAPILPGSGQGELLGIAGELRIRAEGGAHYYELIARLP